MHVKFSQTITSLLTISMHNVLKDEKDDGDSYTRPTGLTGNCTEENKFKDLLRSIKTLGLYFRQTFVYAKLLLY